MDREINTLVAIDPGQTCGLCMVIFPEYRVHVASFDMDLIGEALTDCLPITILICERWFLYPNSKANTFSDMPGPEAIGMMRMWAQTHGNLFFERIAARLRRPWLDYVPKAVRTEHRRDAYSLALYWIARTYGKDRVGDVILWPITQEIRRAR